MAELITRSLLSPEAQFGSAKLYPTGIVFQISSMTGCTHPIYTTRRVANVENGLLLH